MRPFAGSRVPALRAARAVLSLLLVLQMLGPGAGVAAADPDTTPPSVSILSPADGSVATGTVTIEVDASDETSLTGVQVSFAGGVVLGASPEAPFAVTWDTEHALPGTYTITAHAVDSSHNIAETSVDVVIPGYPPTAEGGDTVATLEARVAPWSGTDIPPMGGAYHGYDVDIDGIAGVVGSHLGDSVYVYELGANGWERESRVVGIASGFGSKVAVSGDTLAAGRFGGGQVALYTRADSTWTFQQFINDQGIASYDDIALQGDTLVVGASHAQVPGAAHVYTRTNGVWSPQTTLTLAGTYEHPVGFGHSVAIDGDTIVVGSGDGQSTTPAGGPVAIFVDDGAGNWAREATIAPEPHSPGFGVHVDISGDTLLVAASGDGAAFAYERSGSTWSREARLAPESLLPTNGGYPAVFPSDVSIEGDRAVLTSINEDEARGSAYVFERVAGEWVIAEELVGADPQFDQSYGILQSAGFGSGAAISGDTLLVGAYHEVGLRGEPAVGAAYFYGLSTSATAPSPDTTAPGVDLTSPGPGDTLKHTVNVSADASDTGSGVDHVGFFADGQQVGVDYEAPYSVSWNTRWTTEGTHTLAAVAVDRVGNATTSTAVSVWVQPPDTTPPTVNIITPSEGDEVTGTVPIEVVATDSESPLHRVVIYAGGTYLKTELSPVGTVTAEWDASGAVDGTHTIYAYAYDTEGNAANATARVRRVSEDIDAVAPTTTDDAPAGVQTSPFDVTLTATDAGSGVDATYYTVNAGAEQTYAAPIPVTTEGISTIEYASVDNAGNREATRTAVVELVTDGTSFLTGAVTASGGSPLPDITAYVYRYTGSTWKNAGGVSTDASGTYTIPVHDTGTYRVGFYDPSGTYIREYYDDATSLSLASDLVVSISTVTSDIDAVLEGIGSIEGTVTTEGAPLEGLTVKAYRYENGTWRWRRDATVAADGSYTLTSLREGTYRVSFYDPNKQYIREWYDDTTVISAAVDIPVAAGATVTGISADVAGLGAVAGNVTHDGGPLQGLTVKLYRYNGSIWMWVRDATTNSLGDYSATGLRAGDYRVSFYDPDDRFIREWYDDHLSVYDSDTVVVPAGATATGIDADIEGRDSISGTVTHLGSPVAGLAVKAYLDDGGYAWERDTTTDASGTYTFGGLPLGTYRISFYSPEGTYVREWYDDVVSIGAAQDITVTTTPVTGIDADLVGLGSVSGTVTDVGGGVADIEVKCYRDEGGGSWVWVRDAITASDGTYLATGLREGTYRASFYDPAGTYVREWYDDQASLGAAQDITVTAGVTESGIDALIVAGP